MTNIDSQLLRKFTKIALQKISGDWILIGGTVLPLLNIDHRITVDIDLVPMQSSGNDQTLILMDIAQELGMPIESINQAGAYFLYKVKDWQSHLVLIGETKRSKIYRPDGTLFLQLKISRLSDSDLADCLQMLKFCKKNKEEIDGSLLLEAIEKSLEIEKDLLKQKRLKTLQSALKAY